MSCGFLMPKYVITAYLTYMYFIQYKELAWSGRNYVEKKQFFHVKKNITEFRATNISASILSSQLVYRNNVVKSLTLIVSPKSAHLLPDKSLETLMASIEIENRSSFDGSTLKELCHLPDWLVSFNYG